MIVPVLIALLCSILQCAFFISPSGERFEMNFLDLWFNVRGPIAPPSDVVLVAIDEASYEDLGHDDPLVSMSQPIPRRYHARLLWRLKELGAKRVVFDILFAGAASNSADDQALTEAIQAIPAFLGTESASRTIYSQRGSYTLEELVEPHEPFGRAAAGLALVGLPEDDGVVRRFLTQRTETTRDIPSLAEAALEDSSTGLPRERDMIRYYGPSGTIPTYSLYQVLQDEKPLPRAWFENKIVYVGLVLRSEVGPEQKDVYRSPFWGETIFGVEIHATAGANLRSGSVLQRLPKILEACLLFLICFTLCLALATATPAWGMVIAGSALLLWSAAAFALFLGNFFLPGATVTAVALPLCLLGSALQSYRTARLSEERVKSALSLYLSPQMLKELPQDPKSLTLGGEKLWASALFTDIEGFTRITEEMPAEAVAAMLNDYFTEVMDVALEKRGTLIKFIGDSAFILWGAPIKISDHAGLAIQSALAMQREVERFNQSKRYPALKTRIGINTGPMLVGNLGSRRRFDYTAIGDAVNLASRVEALNKQFGTTILVTESTRKEAAQMFPFVLIASVQVAGKREAVPVYSVFDPPLGEDQLLAWNSARDAFCSRNFSQAREAFSHITRAHGPLAAAAEFYCAHIAALHESEIPVGWKGEIAFQSK